jgi:hypothetical protein
MESYCSKTQRLLAMFGDANNVLMLPPQSAIARSD